jgi:hypothetical protein
MSTKRCTHIDELRWELDRLAARRLSSRLNDAERVRYQQLCDEECERLQQQYG